MLRGCVAPAAPAQEREQSFGRLELTRTLRADLEVGAEGDLDGSGAAPLPVGKEEDESLDSPAVHDGAGVVGVRAFFSL